MLIENFIPPILTDGFNTNKNAAFGGTVSVAGAFSANGNFTVAAAKTLAVTDADKLTVGGVIVPQYIPITYCGQTASATDSVLLIAHRAMQLVAVYEIHSVAAGGASKLQVTKDTSTNAPGAGTDLLTNNTNTGFDLNATANTLQTGTLTATAADLQLAAGDRLSIDFSAAIQSSATVTVTAVMKAI